MEFSDINIQVPSNAAGNIKTFCPQCRDFRKQKNRNDKCLSVNIREGIWNCHHCGWTGTLREKDRKPYTRPSRASNPPTDPMVAWFAKRKINTATLKHFYICQVREYMPQTSQEENCIAFPYTKMGNVVNYKYRDGRKNFKMVSGAELVVFNYDGIRGKRVVIITEGEIDALSVYEAGICKDRNVGVCSVPNGASKGNQRLEFLDNSYEAFSDAEKIIIATDGDEPGQALKAELSRRLGKYRCHDIFYPEGCKDLNEVLVMGGAAAVTACLSNTKQMPVEGIIFLDDFEQEIESYYENGADNGVKIGYRHFDLLYKFAPGRLSVWTGVPGSGKSTFLDQVLIRLSNRHEWTHGVCSFEKAPFARHFKSLSSCYIGKPFHNDNPDTRMTKAELAAAKDFFRRRFFWFKVLEEDLSVDTIVARAIHLVKAYGINGLVVDPYNYIENNRKNGQTETEYVSEVLGKLIMFARNYDVHVFLVAHPRKMPKKDGEYEVPSLYDIAGSQHFFSKPDIGIAVHRCRKNNLVTVYVQKVRYEPEEGKLGFVDFDFDILSSRYRETGEPNYTTEIHWDKSAPVVQQEMFSHSLPNKPGEGIHPDEHITSRYTIDSDEDLPF